MWHLHLTGSFDKDVLQIFWCNSYIPLKYSYFKSYKLFQFFVVESGFRHAELSRWHISRCEVAKPRGFGRRRDFGRDLGSDGSPRAFCTSGRRPLSNGLPGHRDHVSLFLIPHDCFNSYEIKVWKFLNESKSYFCFINSDVNLWTIASTISTEPCPSSFIRTLPGLRESWA